MLFFGLLSAASVLVGAGHGALWLHLRKHADFASVPSLAYWGVEAHAPTIRALKPTPPARYSRRRRRSVRSEPIMPARNSALSLSGS